MATVIDDTNAYFQWVGTSWLYKYPGHTDDDKTTDYFNSTFHGTTNNGDYCLIQWRGKDISIFGARRGNHGVYGVSVDGGDVSYFSGYASPDEFQAVLYATSGLAEGDHQLKISNENAKSSGGSYIWLDIDEVALTGTILPPTTSASSTTPTATATAATTSTTSTSPSSTTSTAPSSSSSSSAISAASTSASISVAAFSDSTTVIPTTTVGVSHVTSSSGGGAPVTGASASSSASSASSEESNSSSTTSDNTKLAICVPVIVISAAIILAVGLIWYVRRRRRLREERGEEEKQHFSRSEARNTWNQL